MGLSPYIFLVIIFYFGSCSLQCNQIMANWLIHPENLPLEVYMNSGKFINDLGDYNNCVFNKNDFTYFTMRFYNKLVGIQYIGLCAPNQCKQEIASNTFALQLETYLNQLYMNKTGSTSGIFFKAVFYIPLQEKPPLNWSNYFTIGLMVFIIILGIIGSVISKILPNNNSIAVKAIKCFSFKDNFKKIIKVSKTNQNQNLLFLNGMRVLSIFWIVFGHDMWFRFMNIKNWMQTIDILTTPGIPTLVPAAYFAVDTFFWIGGFLITIGLIEQIKKVKKFAKFYLGCIVHRLIRIWPTYMLAILIYWKVAPYMGSGPMWNSFSLIAGSCANGGILWNMFFIDNFGNHGPSGMDYCFGWGWYLAVDFQLFLITPFLILAYKNNKKIGWAITFLLFLASIVCAFVLIVVNDWRYPIPNPKMKPQPQFMDEFYYKPYVRASAYFMGIFSGFLYNQWKQGHEKTVHYVNHIKRSIPIRVLFYIIGITMCEFTIWAIMPFQTGSHWSTTKQAFYNAFNRVVFLLGVYLCVFAAMFGCENDPTKYILGHRIFSPLAKVSFCIYLMHLIMIMGGTFSSKMDLYWEPYSAVYIVISDIFWSVIAATCLSLLVQSPTLGLQKLLLKGGGSQKKKKEKIKFEDASQITYTRPTSIVTSLSNDSNDSSISSEDYSSRRSELI